MSELIDDVAIVVREAVAAERERCAKVAEKRGAVLGEHAIGSDIATTIRKQLDPETEPPNA